MQPPEDWQRDYPPYAAAGEGPRGVMPAAAGAGPVGQVPWGVRATALAAALTLIPWYALIYGSLLLGPQGTAAPPANRSQDITRGVVALVVTVLAEGIFLLAPAVLVLRAGARGVGVRAALRALGLRRTPFWRAVGLVVLMLATIFAAGILISLLTAQLGLPLQTNTQTLQAQARAAPFTTIGTLVGAVLVAPLFEETFFRGFLFGGLLRAMPFVPAALLSAVLFVLAHGDLGSAPSLLVIGLVLAYVRWHTGSLWPCVAIHMLNNALAAAVVLSALAH